MRSISTFKFARNDDNASRFISAGRLQSARRLVGWFGAIGMKWDAIQPLFAQSQSLAENNIAT